MNIKYAISAVLISSAFIANASDIDAMEARHQASIASNEGKTYEMKAAQAFFGDAAFMRECAPPGVTTPETVTIYFEVMPAGKMGELLILPEGKVSKCISGHVRDRAFPSPPETYVGKIELTFKE